MAKLKLDLDALYQDGYFYTSFDVGGEGHSITIEDFNKEPFLDEFCQIMRQKAEQFLEEVSDEDSD